MATRKSRTRRNYNINGLNALVIRTDEEISSLNYLEFVEENESISGYRVVENGDVYPLRNLLVETPTKSITFRALRKTNLVKKVYNIYGETENYYIVEG